MARRSSHPFDALAERFAQIFADMRSAKIWANRSAKASNGCEERLAISLHYAKAGRCATYELLSRHHNLQIILLDAHSPRLRFGFPTFVVSPDLRLQHLLLFLLVPLRR